MAERRQQPLLEVEHANKVFVLNRGLVDRIFRKERPVVAVKDVSLQVWRGEIIGIVGESGSGKSTLARAIVRLIDLTSGTIRFGGNEVATLEGSALRPFRKAVQMIFQDSHSALNPRKSIGRMLNESLRMDDVPPSEREAASRELLERVGLGPQLLYRYPHELSGGQRQRVGIARALAMSPELLIADEPVSALDVSLQGQIINLLIRLRDELGLTIVVISHDLAVVDHMCSRVAVMYAGRVVEVGQTKEVHRSPAHPYTQALLESVPKGIQSRKLRSAAPVGHPPDLSKLEQGCPFVSRCRYAMEPCRLKYPKTSILSPTHTADCHLLTS